MTTPSDDNSEGVDTSPERHYASDRHLLLQEIQSLSKDVSKLRGDTKHLNEVIVPREEISRRRRTAFGALSTAFFLLGTSLILFYVSEQRDDRDDAKFQRSVIAFEKATVEACEYRNSQLLNQKDFIVKITQIQAMEAVIAGPPDPRLVPLRDQSAEVFADFIQRIGTPVDCQERARLIDLKD